MVQVLVNVRNVTVLKIDLLFFRMELVLVHVKQISMKMEIFVSSVFTLVNYAQVMATINATLVFSQFQLIHQHIE